MKKIDIHENLVIHGFYIGYTTVCNYIREYHDKKEPFIRQEYGLGETLDHLYTFKPDFISCTYGAGGTNAGRNIEICKAIKESGIAIPVTRLHMLTHAYTCTGNKKEKYLKNYRHI